ncbi:MAG: prepilin-type N-terminal cleavage/methylation domain-containing protein [Candidatus Omnitrophica bacterium]|nr:prepilin-type N-terminal cleavage/methylation domain-containing protein [Candidatus Omnitrophota bacterium]
MESRERVKIFFKTGKRIRSGFTLIEIIFVVMIVLIILGIALPNFSKTYSGVLLNQTAQDLTYSMRYAQSLAINKGIMTRLVVDESKGSYWAEEQLTDDTGDVTDDFVKGKGRLSRPVQVQADIELECEGGQIMFYPDGSIEKKRLYLCRKEKCFTVTTKELWGQIALLNGKVL